MWMSILLSFTSLAPVQEWTIELELADGSSRPLSDGWLGESGVWRPGASALPEDALVARFSGFPERPAPPPGESLRLDLAGGDRLFGASAGGSGDRVALVVAGAAVGLDVAQVRALVFEARIPEDPTLVLEAAASGDRLYRRVAQRLDRVDGTLEGLSAEGVAFESLVGRQVVPWDELAALYIEPLEKDPPRPSGPRAVVISLRDGSRLRGELLQWRAERLDLTLPSGDILGLPLPALAQVEAADGRQLYLSDLDPVAIEPARPFGDELGMVWWPQRDACVSGGALRVGERRYARGYGMATPSALRFELDGTWNRLAGAVAVDASVADLGLEGSVQFRVLCDGKLRFESPELRRVDGLLPLPPIDLTGVSTLELSTSMASDLFEGDRADWIEVKLLR